MQYRCEATTLEGFIQMIAANYLPHGYVFYVTGRVPDGKDPAAVDRKLMGRYGVGISRWARARRKRAGWANLHYLRFNRLWILLATHGIHRFFEDERDNFRDIRRVPLKVGGYSISFRGGHSHVRIELEEYCRLKAFFTEVAAHRVREKVALDFYNLPFEPYAPIRRQLLQILRAVNRVRRAAGYSIIPSECVPFRRRIVKPFESRHEVSDEA